MLKAQATPVRNIRGEVERLVLVARDITERTPVETERPGVDKAGVVV